MTPEQIAHDVGMDELEQTPRQFWMPALVAAFVIFGLPVLCVVGYAIYAALTGQQVGYG
jgi:hypothetical protein